MNFALTKDLEQFIEERLRRGRYPGAEDACRAGLQSLRQQEAIESLSAGEIEAIFPDLRRIAQGLEEPRIGKLTDGDAFFDQLEREDV